MIKNLFDDPLLVIYGGRNDAIFAGTRNVALNDVCMFNTVTREWTSLAMYGIQPCSRWSHVIVPNRECNPNGFLVLGGVNLNNYCRSKLYSFQVLSFGQFPQRQLKAKPQRHASPKSRRRSVSTQEDPLEAQNNAGIQKLQLMQYNAKEKIEVIKQMIEDFKHGVQE